MSANWEQVKPLDSVFVFYSGRVYNESRGDGTGYQRIIGFHLVGWISNSLAILQPVKVEEEAEVNDLLGPFGDEAVAAFIAAIMSAIVAYWLHRRSIQKPSIVLCEELSHANLIVYGLAEMLPFSYGSEVLQNPQLIRLRITNTGSTVIRQPSIIFEVDQSVKMLKPRFRIMPERNVESVDVVQESSNSVTVALDYLNPVQPHKETVLVDLICDGDIESIRALGGGEGWSVQYHTLAEAVRMAYIFAFTGFLVLVLAAITSTAMLILSTSTDSAVSQALITLWNSGYIRLGTVVLTVGVLTVAFLALWGERKSGIPFYKRIFFWMPRALLRQAVDAIFKRRLVP